MLRAKERAPILCSFVVFSLVSYLIPLRSLGACQLGYLKYKLWPKEGLGVKLLICLPWFAYVPHIIRKLSTRAITFLQTSPQSEVCTKSYGPPKSRESQFREFRDSQVGSPMTKWHLGVGPMARHNKYYRGEGDGFSQVQTVVNLVSPCLFMVCSCIKSVTIMH